MTDGLNHAESLAKRLHLLPGTIYAMGAALFAAALISKNLRLGYVGAGVVFFAVSMHMLIDYVRSPERKWKTPACEREVWVFVVQIIVAAILTNAAFCLACHVREWSSELF